MKNYDLLDNSTIQLASGVFAGVASYTCYPGGELECVRLSEKNMLLTHAGELIPAHTETYRRKNKYSVEYYSNGMIKAVALEKQQEIQTPIGSFPAEVVTFFKTGELKRFYQLDGKISGMWSEKEEKSLAIPFSFDLSFTSFTSLPAGVKFYKSGAIRSITLFQDELVDVSTAYGIIPVRNGFSMFESGKLESTEPSEPIAIQTIIGKIITYDPNAIGINADSNSLEFDVSGRVTAMTTVHNRITVQNENDRIFTFSPREVMNPLDDDSTITDGLIIHFDYDANTVIFTDSKEDTIISIADCEFVTTAYSGNPCICSPADCANCSLNCK